jgi:hypothetical protein
MTHFGLRRSLAAASAALLLAGLTASASAAAAPAAPTNGAGLTSAQVATLDRVLVAEGVGAAKRTEIENDMDQAKLIGTAVQETKPAAQESPANAPAPGRCGAGGADTAWSWSPSLYMLNVIGQRLWTETHHVVFCVNPSHNWVTYATWPPEIEPSVTALGGLGGWNYDGVLYMTGGSYEWKGGYPNSGFRWYTRTKWHQCAVKIGCIQTVTPYMDSYAHADVSVGLWTGW